MKKFIIYIFAFIITAIIIICFFRIKFNALPYYEDKSDVILSYWNVSSFSNRINHGENPFYKKNIFYPVGSSLITHTSTPIIGFFNLFIDNPIVSINIIICINLIILFWGFYYLASLYLKSKINQLLIALVCVFNGYILTKFCIHYNLILIGTIPWALYYFRKSINFNAFQVLNRYDFILGLILTITNIFIDYYPIIFILITLAIWFIEPIIITIFSRFSTLKKLIIGLITLAVIHFISRLLYITGFDKKGGIWESADIQQLIIPSKFGMFAKSNLEFINSPLTENFIFIGFPIIFILCFCIYFSIINSKLHKILLYTVLAFMIAIPVIKINGNILFYTPGAITHFIPFLDQFRGPSRYIELFYFFLFLFILSVFENPKSLQKYNTLKISLPIFTISLFLIQQYTRKPNYIDESNFKLTRQELKLTENKIVLTLPFGIRDGLKEMGNFNVQDLKLDYGANTKIFSGYISRISNENWEFYQNNPFFKAIIKLQNQPNLMTYKEWNIIRMGIIKYNVEIIQISIGNKILKASIIKNLELNLKYPIKIETMRNIDYLIINKKGNES